MTADQVRGDLPGDRRLRGEYQQFSSLTFSSAHTCAAPGGRIQSRPPFLEVPWTNVASVT